MAHKWQFLRHPRTTQERRANQTRGRQQRWCRPTRRMNRLPTSWEDIFIHESKSWKNKGREKQYYPVKINGQVKTYTKPALPDPEAG